MSHIEEIKSMMECLVGKAKGQLEGNIENVDAHEMGEVIDMIKDLAEAKYYCKIFDEMEDAEEESEMMDKVSRLSTEDGMRYYNGNRYANGRYAPSRSMSMGRRNYNEYMNYPEVYDPMNDFSRNKGRLYYNDSNYSNGNVIGNRQQMESRYDRARRNYTEMKSSNPDDKSKNMENLEKYMNELSSDMTELIGNMTADEKSTMRQKLTTLANRI